MLIAVMVTAPLTLCSLQLWVISAHSSMSTQVIWRSKMKENSGAKVLIWGGGLE